MINLIVKDVNTFTHKYVCSTYLQYLFKLLYFNIRNNMFSNDMKINYASYLYFILKRVL